MSLYCGEFMLQDEHNPHKLYVVLQRLDPLDVRSLNLRNCAVGNESAALITRMNNLSTMDLSLCSIAGDVLQGIMECFITKSAPNQKTPISVRSISLRHVKSFDDRLVNELSKNGHFARCVSLNISSTSITDLATVAAVFPALHTLRARFMTVKGICTAIDTLNLTELSLEGIENVEAFQGVAKSLKRQQRADNAAEISVYIRGCNMQRSTIDLVTIGSKRCKVFHDFLEFGGFDQIRTVDVVTVELLVNNECIEVALKNILSTMPVRRIVDEAVEELNSICSQEERKRLPVASKARREAYADALRHYQGKSSRYTAGLYCIYEIDKRTGNENRVVDVDFENALLGLNEGLARILIRIEVDAV